MTLEAPRSWLFVVLVIQVTPDNQQLLEKSSELKLGLMRAIIAHLNE